MYQSSTAHCPASSRLIFRTIPRTAISIWRSVRCLDPAVPVGLLQRAGHTARADPQNYGFWNTKNFTTRRSTNRPRIIPINFKGPRASNREHLSKYPPVFPVPREQSERFLVRYYVKVHNPKIICGIYDVVRLDTFCLDKGVISAGDYDAIGGTTDPVILSYTLRVCSSQTEQRTHVY